MKTLLTLLWTITSSIVWAEGVASMTSITTENRGKLDFHTLRVETKSQHGRTSIALFIKTEEKHPLTHCSVTIHAADGKAILAQFDPDLRSPRVYFYVADELVKNVSIMYHLDATGLTSHVFQIKAGEVGKLAKF
jgi:hypothetical protein